ncbi:MAG: lipopolysaccharide heptosyltransferase II [Bryobacteraceae bacterium]
MDGNAQRFARIVVRATNWVGDAVMSLPAVRAIRDAFPEAHIALVARPGVADIYAREESVDRVIPYPRPKGAGARWGFAARLRRERFDAAILLQNAFDAALMAWAAGIPTRIGYKRDARGFLLTHAIRVPERGDIPRHERFYYLELLRRAGVIERIPECDAIRLGGADAARAAGAKKLAEMGVEGPAIGISPGAAYGDAKRWIPERFAEAAQMVGQARAVLVFGAAAERSLCETVAGCLRGVGMKTRNLAGETTLGEFIDLAAACRLFLTNDSGAMHVASALGVPTVAVFGATDDNATGPSSPLARVIRAPADCAPCLLRECPIDHRCMTRVSARQVGEAALQLWEESAPAWTHEPRS